ncbi:4-(cytidine 5'-diphospho)-2-C-methyl-D-erythritol kinase [bacterium]|nr:4-(cytidine 5'-diphospho)-2-C-methyl-D-erythritol kinase [bacterium]
MQSLLAPAKINLFLRIVRRREDGYHEIETLFQAIGLYDNLCIQQKPLAAQPVDLEIPGHRLKETDPENNLVVKAWKLLSQHSGPALGPIRARLQKHIPVGGGLGGGSSDAAATLRGLRHLYDLDIDDEALAALALKLGADVPFFLGPPCAIGRGIGEQLTPAPRTAPFWAILACPPFGVATPEVYRRYQPAATHETGNLTALLAALAARNCQATLSACFNEMEELAFGIEPRLGHLRAKLEQIAARPVRMSGSGSTLYTLAASRQEAEEIAQTWASQTKSLCAPFLT